ncbi:MAG: P1 family peptidase [Bacteroidales bacterium]
MKYKSTLILCILVILFVNLTHVKGQKRLRDYGVSTGVMETGKLNAITDVPHVKVGHSTLIRGDSVRTGVTAVLPHSGNIFQNKVPAAIHIGNGFGKLTGYTQVKELGNIETPVVLTNTLSVPAASEAIMEYTLNQPGNEKVRSVNPVVGETNDGWLNDIRGMHISKKHVYEAIENATDGIFDEGSVGAGTGTICFGFKGGIGTSSRVLPAEKGGYKVGVLVQTNYGGVLQVAGVPVGVELDQYYLNDDLNDNADGSCMIVVATDAPLSSRNLERLANRAMLGLARTGGISSNGSGDYVIAFSTNEKIRIDGTKKPGSENNEKLLNNDMSPLFMATIEATEEAILNSLFTAKSMEGRDGNKIEALPVEKTLEIMKRK